MKKGFGYKKVFYYASGLAVVSLIILLIIQIQFSTKAIQTKDIEVLNENIHLIIDSELNYFLNTNPIDSNQLIPSVKELLSEKNSLYLVVLEADKSVSAKHLKEIADQLKKIKVKIAIATQPE